jgi:hypothetical protein
MVFLPCSSGGCCQGEEELAAIVVLLARVGHAQQPPSRVLQPAVELVGKGLAIVAALSALPRARGVAALQDEALDQAVEDGVVVVAIETQLQEVARRDGRLLGEELDLEIARGRVQDDFGRRVRLEVVRRGHVGDGVPLSRCVIRALSVP